MANSRFYSSTALETQLNGNINNSAVTITLASNVGFPGTLPFTLALDYNAANEELVEVTAGTNPYTITRAIDGTSATSHNTGATVRHVSSARDFTDSRTHEAAVSGVHGVAGTIVGTSDTQTLTNKTLTSPTINSGALSGTFTGTHTYSGAVTLSGSDVLSGTLTSSGGTLSGTFAGTPTFSGTVTHTGEIAAQNLVRGTRATAADSQYETRVTADARARWFIQADGKQLWGDGTNVADVSLYRLIAGTLKTDNSLSVGAGFFPNAGINVTGTILDVTTNVPYKTSQSGTATVNFAAATQMDAAVVFPVAFAVAPVVVCSRQNSPANSAKVMVNATGITTTGFTMRFNTGDATAVTITGLTGGYIATP